MKTSTHCTTCGDIDSHPLPPLGCFVACIAVSAGRVDHVDQFGGTNFLDYIFCPTPCIPTANIFTIYPTQRNAGSRPVLGTERGRTGSSRTSTRSWASLTPPRHVTTAVSSGTSCTFGTGCFAPRLRSWAAYAPPVGEPLAGGALSCGRLVACYILQKFGCCWPTNRPSVFDIYESMYVCAEGHINSCPATPLILLG